MSLRNQGANKGGQETFETNTQARERPDFYKSKAYPDLKETWEKKNTYLKVCTQVGNPGHLGDQRSQWRVSGRAGRGCAFGGPKKGRWTQAMRVLAQVGRRW